jgi:IS30 family transposase
MILLTLHFVKCEFMLAFLRDQNTAASVFDVIERLYLELRPDRFMNLFPVLLGAHFISPNDITLRPELLK